MRLKSSERPNYYYACPICGHRRSRRYCEHCYQTVNTQAKRWLQELLAYIHRDGGQYTGKHGLEKSYKDAITKVCDLIHGELDE